MNIRDIFDRILLRSGQYIIRKAKVDIDVDTFRILVEDALADYSKAVPYECDYDLNMNASRNYVFPNDFDPVLLRSPDWLSEVTPISSFGSLHTVFGHRQSSDSYCSEVIDPIEAPWVFNSKTKNLTVPFSANYKVTACYKHRIVATLNTSTGETDFTIPTITIDDQIFFRFLQGKFLQGIGRSRRAFTLSDLPIIMDADQMVSDGVEMVDRANEDMNNVQKFHLAFG
jgi:hypothetical protein